ncbi:hypothetical protein COY07_00430 [Candidatus Peregrinibacteria bacterium CG_4_10_14_0_2_um_filter_43_11]|nr:MAG: hypothetical protein COY07_00430 [Candidatus Peregrinibacteria bacterium CG_4_10_14_0_2_um_filter_43_11]
MAGFEITAQDILKIDAVRHLAEEKTLKQGDYVFKEGQEDDHFYVILEGEIEISVKTSEGNEKVIAYVKPGELLGEGTLSGKTLKPASARAFSEVRLLALSYDNFTKMIAEDAPGSVEFLLKVLGMVNNRLHQTNLKMLAIFEISRMMTVYRDDLVGLCKTLIRQLIALTQSSEGIVLIKNSFSQTYRTIYSTTPLLSENLINDLDIEKPQYFTGKNGHLLVMNLKQSGVIILSRPISDEPFEDGQLRLVQMIAEQAAGIIDDASRRAIEKARTVLHQQKVVL